MSYIARPDDDTDVQQDLLDSLENLAVSSNVQFLRKATATTFSNVAVVNTDGLITITGGSSQVVFNLDTTALISDITTGIATSLLDASFITTDSTLTSTLSVSSIELGLNVTYTDGRYRRKITRVLVVDGSGAGDYSTVAAAIADASSGDVIEVMPGTYNESGLVLPSGVDLIGGGRGRTFISRDVNNNIIALGGSNYVFGLSFSNANTGSASSVIQTGGNDSVINSCFVSGSVDTVVAGHNLTIINTEWGDFPFDGVMATGGTIIIKNCVVNATPSTGSSAAFVNITGATLYLENCYINLARSANEGDISIVRTAAGTNTVYSTGNRFILDAGTQDALAFYGTLGTMTLNSSFDSFQLTGGTIAHIASPFNLGTFNIMGGGSVDGDTWTVSGSPTVNYREQAPIKSPNFISTVAIGTQPYACTSTTVNTNLNADMLDGKHTGTSGNTVPLLDGANIWSATQNFDSNPYAIGISNNYISGAGANSYLQLSAADDGSDDTITLYTPTNPIILDGTVIVLLGPTTAPNFISNAITGTVPYSCTSTTLNTNLNADLWDGNQFSTYLNQAVLTSSSPSFVSITLSGVLNLPTTSSSTVGVINQNSVSLIHTYGSNNLFIGSNAGNFTTTGSGANVAVGDVALRNITTGNQNFALGQNSLGQLTEGISNVAIGRSAITTITTGADNTAIGRNAGTLLPSTSAGNTIVGSFGFRSAVGAAVSNNTMIGAFVARDTTGSPAFNTVIGTWAGRNMSGSSNVFLGYFAGVDETGSNTLIIGNRDAGTEAQNRADALIYGLFPAHASGPLLNLNATTQLLADNRKFFWGAGSDASIYYDGTNLVVNPKEVGTGILDLQGGLSVDSITNDTGLAAGTYTPTLTNGTNVAASTAYQCQYMRVGNTVTVSGRIDIDQTAAGNYDLEISLPIASNLGAIEDLAGIGVGRHTATVDAFAIIGEVTNNTAQILGADADVTNQAHAFTFVYQVI